MATYTPEPWGPGDTVTLTTTVESFSKSTYTTELCWLQWEGRRRTVRRHPRALQLHPAHRIPQPMVAVVLTLEERHAPAHLMAIAVPSGDGVAQHPTAVAIWFATVSMAHATQFPKNYQSRKMASAVSTASSAQLVLVRRLVIAAIGLANADLAPHTALPRTAILITGTAAARACRSALMVNAARTGIPVPAIPTEAAVPNTATVETQASTHTIVLAIGLNRCMLFPYF